MEGIFRKEANEPYLRYMGKASVIGTRYIKVEKTLDKIKSLVMTSNFYKIRFDTSSPHKNRSYFKKIYLSQEKKMVENPKIQNLAQIYELKYKKRIDKS